jgi:nicotinate-nucleotide--dimethylbenzimidazole phosphoribosyltransferase
MASWSQFDIPKLESSRSDAAQEKLDALAKPPGSLGMLEQIAVRLSSIQDLETPRCDHPQVIVFAGDHGVAWQDQVSPYPPQVTAKMVETFVKGKAAVSALSRQAGAYLEVVNCGVVGVSPDLTSTLPDVAIVHEPARSEPCGNIARESAMTLREQEICFRAGRAAAARAMRNGRNIVAIGEMGIGNTTSASAITAKILGISSAEVTGPGTGLTGAALEHKKHVVDQAVKRCQASSALHILQELGGFEINAMTACILACAELRIPVVLDGFIASTAALAAVRHDAACRPYLFAATLSTEPGHHAVLRSLEIGPPLLQLGLRLGEASGAALALPIFAAACRIPVEMATLAEVLGTTGE